MTKRRPLVEGLAEEKEELSDQEKQFVYGQSDEARSQSTQTEIPKVLPSMKGRVPITIRVHAELGSTLKRVSLQRQLDGIEPSSIQDIVAEALENWFKAN